MLNIPSDIQRNLYLFKDIVWRGLESCSKLDRFVVLFSPLDRNNDAPLIAEPSGVDAYGERERGGRGVLTRQASRLGQFN